MKKLHSIALGLFLLLNVACGQNHKKSKTTDTMQHTYTNDLINESSPYLLQHAHNPVNWHAWNEATLKLAQAENKMLIISIGYSACHWCHVMEHESFEDSTVAKLMNDHFICIKVDREERPDVDQIYMNAVQLMTGSGGWPLNALALPDGRPFFAGTYFPKGDWLKVLNYFIDVRKNKPAVLTEQAEKVTQGIHSQETVSFNNSEASFSMQDLDKSFNSWKPKIDFQKGGRIGAPKFPMPAIWEYLLHYSRISDNDEALRAVTSTLNHMAFGGIYDQIGGGFARYSTDNDWLVPHFEKMLYDNSQLISLYTHAWQKTKNPLYQQVVYETLEFIEREMTSPEGGFYSALDADSEGEEGKYYVWTKAEIEQALGKDAAVFNAYYNVSNKGNWEHGKNILFRDKTAEDIAKKHKISVPELSKTIEKAKATLLDIRSKRIRPGLDDKILTAWNALMLKAYAQAYRSFGEEKFLRAALKNAKFLQKNAIGKDGQLSRNHKDGKSSITGFLDDYAFVISAFLELYQATFDEKWLEEAYQLSGYTLEHFFDEKSGMFFYTSDLQAKLISRKMEITDNVIPASNSEMAKNLFVLGNYYYNEDYINKSRQMMLNVQKDVHQNLNFYANWAMLEINFVEEPYTVAIIGADFEAIRQKMDQYYLPQVLLLGGKGEGKLQLLEGKLMEGQTTIYVCKNKVCKLPVTNVQDALKQLN